jgi:hypothetical protein
MILVAGKDALGVNCLEKTRVAGGNCVCTATRGSNEQSACYFRPVGRHGDAILCNILSTQCGTNKRQAYWLNVTI